MARLYEWFQVTREMDVSGSEFSIIAVAWVDDDAPRLAYLDESDGHRMALLVYRYNAAFAARIRAHLDRSTARALAVRRGEKLPFTVLESLEREFYAMPPTDGIPEPVPYDPALHGTGFGAPFGHLWDPPVSLPRLSPEALRSAPESARDAWLCRGSEVARLTGPLVTERERRRVGVAAALGAAFLCHDDVDTEPAPASVPCRYFDGLRKRAVEGSADRQPEVAASVVRAVAAEAEGGAAVGWWRLDPLSQTSFAKARLQCSHRFGHRRDRKQQQTVWMPRLCLGTRPFGWVCGAARETQTHRSGRSAARPRRALCATRTAATARSASPPV